MNYWVKFIGVITTGLVFSFPAIEELGQNGKLKNSPAFAQDISYSQSNSQSQINSLLKEGAAYYQDWEFEKALEKFQEALKLRREMGNLEAEARALFYVGATYNKLQQGEKALNYYWEVMGVAEEARSQQEFEKISKYLCKNQEGRQYLQRQKFFHNQKLNIQTYCQGIPWEGDSGSVTLLIDEDEKEE